MRLFVNAVAASAGGGLTYLRNVLPHFSALRDVQTTFLVSEQFHDGSEYSGCAGCSPDGNGLERVSLIRSNWFRGGAARRFFREQLRVPGMIRRFGCEVLVSAGNIGLARSPVPQILLARNSLYASSDFYADVRARGQHRLWLKIRAESIWAKRSILRSDRVVVPSRAFADAIRSWCAPAQPPLTVIPHGFDRDTFFNDRLPLVPRLQETLDACAGSLRILSVSHYNYFRNFDTLVRALPVLKRRLGGRPVKLILTCALKPGAGRHEYDPGRTAALARELGVEGDIVALGSVPYSMLHRVYRSSDLFVTAAYAESFAHPLVEAMACGLPIIASDLAVHQEVCAGAARYFPRFSAESLADRVVEVAGSWGAQREMAEQGIARAGQFSWKKHVDALVALAAGLRHTVRARDTGR
jgi:glycosyltransferase involved in cell wall biosynthesis